MSSVRLGLDVKRTMKNGGLFGRHNPGAQ